MNISQPKLSSEKIDDDDDDDDDNNNNNQLYRPEWSLASSSNVASDLYLGHPPAYLRLVLPRQSIL